MRSNKKTVNLDCACASADADANAKMTSVCILIAFVLALLFAVVYGHNKINAADFALGMANSHTTEVFGGKPLTGSSIDDIHTVISMNQHTYTCSNGHSRNVIWLGNSQLHTINQFQQGQHLAPYWLTKSYFEGCLRSFGLTLPNANLQEYLVLSNYATRNFPVDAVVLSLVFDDLREDDLRSEFFAMLDDRLRGQVGSSLIGKEILAKADKAAINPSVKTGENHGLEGFVQKRIEDNLTYRLGQIFPLWAERPNLRVNLLTDLYYLRNYVLGIKPTTVRKLIPSRFARNMAALEAILADLSVRGIKVVLYVAPIRQDISLPYDPTQYSHWKIQVEKLASQYSAQYLNLETLVPASMWGTYHADDVDFMHFQGEGHRLLAQALRVSVDRAVGNY